MSSVLLPFRQHDHIQVVYVLQLSRMIGSLARSIDSSGTTRLPPRRGEEDARTAKKKNEEINKLHNEFTRSRRNPQVRRASFVLHVAIGRRRHIPPVHPGLALTELYGDTTACHSFQDKVYAGAFPTLAMVLYSVLGQQVSPQPIISLWTTTARSWFPEDQASYPHSPDGPPSGVAEDKEIRSPRQLNANSLKRFHVVKKCLPVATSPWVA